MNYLPCIEIEPQSSATAAVIWLHGLGADGNDFAPIVPDLNMSDELPIRFIFPHAPSIPVTINGGALMPAWYDILEMNIERKINHQQLLNSAIEIEKLIRREMERGISSERIILIGFSQGGAVAYQTALCFEKPLAGLLALSTYVASVDSIKASAANKKLPVHIQHGTQDPVVPELLGRQAYKSLQDMGYQVSYKNYLMQHNVCAEQVGDIRSILVELLG